MDVTPEVFSVADVYEHAASIGKDIEYIVNQYGKEAIEEIMPKIVYVLEQLERLAETHHQDNGHIQDLMMERDKLIIHSKRDEAIQRELEEKLSYMEGLVTKDKKDLEQKLKLLQRDNNNMLDELEKRDDELVKLRTHGALPGDVEVMMRMKTTIDGQRDQIRHLNHETQAQRKEIEALEEQTTRLSNINEQWRAKALLSQSKLKKYEDTTDGELNDSLSDVNGSDVVKTNGSIDHNSSSLSLHDELTQENELVSENTNSTTDLSMATSLTSDEQDEHLPSLLPQQQSQETQQETSQTSQNTPNGKKDPNRPRYTLQEMQSMLEERNLYKIKMMALEEELQLYKDGNATKTSSELSVDNQITQQKSGVRNFMQKFLGK